MRENLTDGFLFPQRQQVGYQVFDEQLKDYIVEWRKQRTREEDDLRRLKEKQASRKVSLYAKFCRSNEVRM